MIGEYDSEELLRGVVLFGGFARWVTSKIGPCGFSCEILKLQGGLYGHDRRKNGLVCMCGWVCVSR